LTKVEFEERTLFQSHTRGKRAPVPLRANGWTLDLKNRQVVTGNGVQKLTPMLCRLLEVFMRNPGRILDRGFLMREVWETNYLGDTRTLEVHVCWLRKKVEEDPRRPRYLRTVRGVGYHFSVPE
jgi:DNA-binding response OmpR family regulator